ATRGGDSPDGRKVKGTIHWVSASHARRAEIRKFQHLFASETAVSDDLAASLIADSLTVVDGAWVEPALVNADVGRAVQFERLGYFCLDPDSTDDLPVFNQVVSLKDTWKKIQNAA
ncbi:MAG: glutamine--tRNA ligase, partial [Hyphomicrobiaceae bacterium]